MLSGQLQYRLNDEGRGESWKRPENRGVLAAEGLRGGDWTSLTQEAVIWDLCPGLS